MKIIQNRLGSFVVDYADLEKRARELRVTNPELFTVRKLAQALHCGNHSSSRVYMKILRGG